MAKNLRLFGRKMNRQNIIIYNKNIKTLMFKKYYLTVKFYKYSGAKWIHQQIKIYSYFRKTFGIGFGSLGYHCHLAVKSIAVGPGEADEVDAIRCGVPEAIRRLTELGAGPFLGGLEGLASAGAQVTDP